VSERPGAALLVSLVAEEWRGRPGPARNAALESTQKDPEHRADHLLDAAYASLVAGEPRLARQTLDEVEAASDDGEVQRRAAACRAWATQLDDNWYPGNLGAELRSGALERLNFSIAVTPGHGETRLVEACVANGPLPLFTHRHLIEATMRHTPRAVEPLLSSGLKNLDSFRETAREAAAVSVTLWAGMAGADLAWRAGFAAPALQEIEEIRAVYEELGDREGLAASYAIEGDWWATPGASPETLGFELSAGPSPSPTETHRDDERAAAAYRRAGALLQGLDAPRCIGAVALRRAALAFRAGRFDHQRAWLDTALQAFTDAGDAAACHLTIVHRLIADIARGDFETARRAAPTEWAPAPHGPIGQLVQWARSTGSISYCAGLGRLLQRAGGAWQNQHDLERAEHALLLAAPLLAESDAIPQWNVPRMLTEMDIRRNLPARGLVRALGVLTRLPEPAQLTDPMRWLEQIEVATSLVQVLSGVPPTSASTVVHALERASDRLKALQAQTAIASGQPAVAGDDIAAALRQITEQRATLTVEELAAEAQSGTSQAEPAMVGLASQLSGDQVTAARTIAAFHRARRAERGGWDTEAAQWYDEAMRRAESGNAGMAWFTVLVLAARGQDDEALKRFESIRASGTLAKHLLASLALRAGAYQIGHALFTELPLSDGSDTEVGWSELSDRAEAELHAGDPRVALALGRQGIARFERAIAGLSRDSDRIAATDDVSAASLYQLTARACLAAAGAPDQTDTARRAESFDVVEGARSLTLRILMQELTSSSTRDEARSRQLHSVATERATAYQRLIAAHEHNDPEEIRRREEELAAAEAALADVEIDLPRRQVDFPAAQRWVPPFSAAEAKRVLPPDACVLAYHVIGRDLMRWVVTADGVDAAHVRFSRHLLEGQVNRLLRACADGDPGVEAGELADVLLDPFDDVLETHRRVVVVSTGALATLPFHALPHRGAPLGATHVVSYLPAASLLMQTPLDDPLSGYGAVVVGDPAFDPASHPTLRRLPGAALEAAVVGQLHRARDVMIDTAATEERLRRTLRGRAIVHLAAHGYIDEIAPNTSAIVLAGNDRLTVADLVGLRVDAGLAVLSACDTGRGSAVLGGDVIGLVRGLFAAGVLRSIVSLWPVDDVVACATMIRFHEELIKGVPPAHALAAAQGAVRQMTAAQLGALYRDLGGHIEAGTRSLRRRADDRNGKGLAIPLDPEFIDAENPDDEEGADVLDGRLACAWAPFVLVGC
jgi:CHAT domain-containing protein